MLFCFSLSHMPTLRSLALLSLLVCTACASQSNTDSVALSSSASSLVATQNVSYIGVVVTAEATPNATHRLQLQDGSFVSLSPFDSALSLEKYLGKKIEARGSSIPQSDGTELLRVSEVIVMDQSSSSSISQMRKMCGGIAAIQCSTGFTCTDDLEDDCDPEHGGADCAGVCIPVSQESSSSISSNTLSSLSSSLQSSASFSRSSSSSLSVSSSSSLSSSSLPSSSSSSVSSLSSSKDQSAQIDVMTKQKYESPLWTQKYCSTHIGFCIAAHKNWYFKSFGVQENSLWHVEFGIKSLENIGDGVISLDLRKGSSASAGGVSKEIQVQGESIVGFSDFGSNHFEITGAPSLREAILFMLHSIEATL